MSSRLSSAKFLKSRWATPKNMGATKPVLPLPFNYFTPYDLNRHFTVTVSRHPPITQTDLETILQSQIIPPQGLAKLNFTATTEEKILTTVKKLSAKSMGHDAILQHMLKLGSPIALLPYATALSPHQFFPPIGKKLTLTLC